MHHYWTYIEVPNDYSNEVSFFVQLKNGTRFILNDCYFTIYQELFEPQPDSDSFYVELVAQCDKEAAEEKIKRAVELLTYITGIPYELDYLHEDNNICIQPIDINYSRKKIERINSINFQYGRIKSKKELLKNTLRLYALSVKYELILDDAEEAYFSQFRIIEKIAKDEFAIEKNSINKGQDNIRDIVKRIIQDNYGIRIPVNKIDDLTGNMVSYVYDMVFSDVYAKIAWFCAKRNIEYEEETLGKAVKIRNALAHGDNIKISDMSKEYKLISRLAHQFIYKKFFNNIKKCYLEAHMKP